MKLKQKLLQTDLILLIGLFLGVVKTADSLSILFAIPQWLDSLLTLGMCACYGLFVLLRKPSLKRLAVYAVAAAIGMYSALRSGDMSCMITMLTCMAMADCDFDRAIEKLFQWNLAFFLLNSIASVILAFACGFRDALVHEYNGYLDIGYVVHLGFGHKNIMTMHMVNIFLLWLWNCCSRIQLKHLTAVVAACTVFLVLDQCKAGAGILVFVYLMVLYFRLRKKETSRLLQVGAALGPTALFAFSIGSAYLYRLRHPFGLFLSKVMTGRIHLCATAWEQYGMTFFGHLASEVLQVENRVLFMDNVYIYCMVQIGMLWAIAYCVAFFLLAKKSKDLRVHLCIACWCLYSFVEFSVINGLMFMPALLPALLLSQKKNADCLTTP